MHEARGRIASKSKNDWFVGQPSVVRISKIRNVLIKETPIGELVGRPRMLTRGCRSLPSIGHEETRGGDQHQAMTAWNDMLVEQPKLSLHGEA
jgi:hypothetical protein